MGASIAASLAAFFVVAGLVSACRRYWDEVHALDGDGHSREFLRWLRFGLFLPLCWWFGWNLVALLVRQSGLPPLLASGSMALGSSPHWPGLILGNAAVLAVFLGSSWSAITFVWLLPQLLPKLPEPAEYKTTAIAVSIVALLLILWPLWRGSIGGSVLVVLGWSWLMVHNALPHTVVVPPSYARAIAHLKFGRYEQAEEAVIEELEKKDDDYDGWLMLAEMYAEHFGEVAEAERTIHELCEQPGVGPFAIARALNRLAEWQLRLADDPAAARRTLGEICERLPDTNFSLTASHRLREMPLSREEAKQRRQPRTIRLPALSEGAAEGAARAPTAEQRLVLREQAARLSERLEVYPDQTAIRERLARVLTEGLGEVDAGTRQLQLLLQGGEAATPRRAEWLGLLAAWTLRLRRDEPGARQLFEQIIQEYPTSPQALAARRQLHLLDQPPEPEISAVPPACPKITVKLDPT